MQGRNTPGYSCTWKFCTPECKYAVLGRTDLIPGHSCGWSVYSTTLVEILLIIPISYLTKTFFWLSSACFMVVFSVLRAPWFKAFVGHLGTSIKFPLPCTAFWSWQIPQIYAWSQISWSYLIICMFMVVFSSLRAPWLAIKHLLFV